MLHGILNIYNGLLIAPIDEVLETHYHNSYSFKSITISFVMSTNSSTTNITQVCTLSTCPLSEALITYQPSIGGNATFLSFFGTLFLVHLYLGIRHKTWSYMAAMILGLILEGIGYIGRLQLYDDPFGFSFFLEYVNRFTY
jgi:hypothetical protein